MHSTYKHVYLSYCLGLAKKSLSFSAGCYRKTQTNILANTMHTFVIFFVIVIFVMFSGDFFKIIEIELIYNVILITTI